MAAAAAAKTAKSSDLCPETFGHGRKKKGRKEGRKCPLSLLREQIIRSKMCKYCSREAAGKGGGEKRHRCTNQQHIFERLDYLHIL